MVLTARQFDMASFQRYSEFVTEDWVEILMTYDPLEAEMIKDLLESGGIPVVLRSSKVSPYPVNIGRMGEIKILVRKEDEETAENVIKEGNEREQID
ncbi:MAG TPA: hypothetical protein DCP92_22395 [Nitrospiraceae bacterium]|jgi:hypothetical protein|nr:hypothetical protein [Nitrospiraceae bacterium]